MWQLIWSQLRFQRGRSTATVLALVVAVTSFALLSSASRGARLAAVGTVHTNYRPLYDLLVRPKAGVSPAERQLGDLLPTDGIDGTTGGIAEAQWHAIEKLPDIDAAAPVAIGGYAMETAEVPIDLGKYLKPGVTDQVIRVTPTWTYDNGTSHITDGSIYLYLTTDPLKDASEKQMDVKNLEYSVQTTASGAHVSVCALDEDDDFAPLPASEHNQLLCRSTTSPQTLSDYPVPVGRDDVLLQFTFPMLIAAVDPTQEAKLQHLDQAVVSGRYLGADEGVDTMTYKNIQGMSGTFSSPTIPVLTSSTPGISDSATLDVQQLSPAAVTAVKHHITIDTALPVLNKTAGKTVGQVKVTAAQGYAPVLNELADPHPFGLGGLTGVDTDVHDFWSVGAQSLTTHPGGTAGIAPAGPPKQQTWGDASLDDGFSSYGGVWPPVPMAVDDTPTRTTIDHGPPLDLNSANFAEQPDRQGVKPRDDVQLHTVGVFDPAKVDLGPSLAPAPRDALAPTGAPGATAADRSALNGKPLEASSNILGPVGQRATLITSLSALKSLETLPYRYQDIMNGLDPEAPISQVEVRLTGSIGPDAVSKERLRETAQRIEKATGLQVDIVDGSSAVPVNTTIPKGRYGRPAVTVAQPWIKRGIATMVVNAADRKSLLLAFLVLISCALAVGNATSAAVRTRSTELGVLACLGWHRNKLFALILAETCLGGLVAGIVGSMLAFALAPLMGVHLHAAYVLLALPAALVLTASAALLPALRATRADPGAAVRPAVAMARRPRPRRRVIALARGNVLRAPGRTLLGALSLALGVAALTLLLLIDLAFKGAVTGNLLGDAITVQTQPTDYLAAALTLLLGAISVADVLYVNIRERASEFALLEATGWTDRHLTRLAAYEAAAIGLLGSLTGAAAALTTAHRLNHTIPQTGYYIAAAAVAAALAIAVTAAIVPIRSLRTLPTARLLAGE